MYLKFVSVFPTHFDVDKKVMRMRFNCPIALEEQIFLDHTSYVFADKVVIRIFVYLLVTNPLLCENIVNLFEHTMTT